MIQTICLGHVLREAVTTPYRNLVTRPTGAAVRGRIERTMRDSGCHVALLDFSDVELLDLSCADEIVAKLLLLSAPSSERRNPMPASLTAITTTRVPIRRRQSYACTATQPLVPACSTIF